MSCSFMERERRRSKRNHWKCPYDTPTDLFQLHFLENIAKTMHKNKIVINYCDKENEKAKF